MLTASLIELIKYIINNNNLTLQKLARHEQKTQAYIRNEIAKANEYLTDPWQITIKNSVISTRMEYPQFLSFMEILTFKDYLASLDERIQVIVVLSYFYEYVNLSELYHSWNISLTTKKQDMKHLEKLLQLHGLVVERKPGTGIKITGNILRYRILLITIISKCVDVYDFQLEKRGANNPLESQIYQIFMNETTALIPEAQSYIQNFLNDYGNKINYYSKKFFLIYVILSLYPLADTALEQETLRLKPLNLYLFPMRKENIAFNQVVSMIDFEPMMPFPHDETLYQLTENLVDEIQSHIKTMIHTRRQVVEEIYGFVYRQYFFNYFNYKYDDKLVMYTSLRYPMLYKRMCEATKPMESYLDATFNEEQISSLTMIFSKWISKNRLHGRNTTKIVLVTNVGFERVAYFIEKLKDHIDFEHVETIDVNELHLLKNLSFDLILSFSNRTTTIIKKFGYDSLKIKFFIDNDDLMRLMQAGCSISRRRIIAEHLVDELAKRTKSEQIEYLTSKYETFFL